jgi:hypothetical protein
VSLLDAGYKLAVSSFIPLRKQVWLYMCSLVMLITLTGAVVAKETTTATRQSVGGILTPVDMAVIAACSAQLNGGKAVRSVKIEAAALEALGRARFRNPGFRLKSFNIVLRNEAPEHAGNVILGSHLDFVGPEGRKASMLLTTIYSWSEHEVVIHNTHVQPMYQSGENMVPYFAFVSPGKVRLNLLRPDVPFAELVEFVKKNALSAEVLSQAKPGKQPYYVFAFFPERLPVGDQLELRVSSRAKGGGGEVLDTWQLDDDGWRVAVSEVQLDMTGGKKQFIKAVLIPSDKAKRKRGEQRIGIISTRLNAEK